MTTQAKPQTFVGKRFTKITVALLAVAAFVIAAVAVVQLVETASSTALSPNAQLGVLSDAAYLAAPDSTLGENLLLAVDPALSGLDIGAIADVFRTGRRGMEGVEEGEVVTIVLDTEHIHTWIWEEDSLQLKLSSISMQAPPRFNNASLTRPKKHGKW